MTHVAIVSASIGAGHDGVAHELGRRLSGAGHEVSYVDFLDLLPEGLGRRLRGAYAWELAHAARTWGWLLSVMQHRAVGSLAAGLATRASAVRTLACLTPAPDIVVSTYPLASQVLGALRLDGRLAAPVVTYLTDLSVHRLWVGTGVDLHLALHPESAAQAQRLGGRTRLIAPAVAPQFHRMSTLDERAEVRQHHGIPLDRPAALVVGGSWGVGRLAEAMREVAFTGLAVPVALCGNNSGLRERLGSLGHGPALGWVDEMGPLLRSCDVVIQNAGGLTSLQALACGVPVLSYRCLSGHGVTNAAGLDRAGYARWVRHPVDLPQALAGALAGPAPQLVDRPDPAAVIQELLANRRRTATVKVNLVQPRPGQVVRSRIRPPDRDGVAPAR